MILKILKFIFITLGIIFAILITAIILFVVFDPFGLMPVLSGLITNNPNSPSANTELNDKHPLLNESQEKLLETIGVDVENLPTEITPEMEACFTETLGAERVKEIMEGATPNPFDLFKAKGCLE